MELPSSYVHRGEIRRKLQIKPPPRWTRGEIHATGINYIFYSCFFPQAASDYYNKIKTSNHKTNHITFNTKSKVKYRPRNLLEVLEFVKSEENNYSTKIQTNYNRTQKLLNPKFHQCSQNRQHIHNVPIREQNFSRNPVNIIWTDHLNSEEKKEMSTKYYIKTSYWNQMSHQLSYTQYSYITRA